MNKLFMALAWAGICLMSPLASAVEMVQWQRLPIPVQLRVDQERIVFIDRNVRVATPRSLQNRLRVQSIAGAVYLKPNAAIEPTRLQLQDTQTGEIFLLDITTTQEALALEPLEILVNRKPSDNAEQQTAADSPLPARSPTPVVLTRYAAQMMYAPLRTIEPLPGIKPATLRLSGPLANLLPTQHITAVPLSAWSLEQWTVTAVRVTHQRPQRLELDPRHLQGDFYSAAFQHAYLGAAGTPEDTTMLYLVTRNKGLESALIQMPLEVPLEQ